MRTALTAFWAFAAVWPSMPLAPQEAPQLPPGTRNRLSEAKITSNLGDYRLGLRGNPSDMIFDPRRGAFLRASEWHEYGVGFDRDLGVVPETKPAWWMAEWPGEVEVDLIALSGVYPNQPQPDTAWKIELRRDGTWTTHARGVGGWYDRGRTLWRAPDGKPLRLDAFRLSVFSKDGNTPLKSIHFRGEEGFSWVVGRQAPLDALLLLPATDVRSGQPALLAATARAGKVTTWTWHFGDGGTGTGAEVRHVYARPGRYTVVLTYSDGKHTEKALAELAVLPPVAARIAPLTRPVMAGQPVPLAGDASIGKVRTHAWDFGDGTTGSGAKVEHAFEKPGVYAVRLKVSDGTYEDETSALLRVHTPETVHVPQVVLDTDAKNEQDDQHYLGYALFSELDLLAINSIHHGGGQEPVNYAEILHVIDLAKQGGLPDRRVATVCRGADGRLAVPASGVWHETAFERTAAGDAILAAARGASPANPVWIVPVGPGTNTAAAILQARREGLELRDRLRVMWLGGSDNAITHEFNGNNDPWSMTVVCQSGVETWIMPAPVGARVAVDKRSEGGLYADTPLGQYLLRIVPAANKPLFDPSCLSAIIGLRLGLDWIRETEPVTVSGPEHDYRWTRTDGATPVRVIRQIDQEAMKRDLFETMKGRPTRLIGAPPPVR